MKRQSVDNINNPIPISNRFLPIQSREWRNMFLLTGLIILITTLPYLIGWLRQSDDWVFTGFLFGAEDGQDYLGRIRLGARSYWSVHIFYTAETHDGIPPLFWVYLLPGQVLGLFFETETLKFQLALAVMFHFLRILGILIYAGVSFRFISYFVANPGWRFTTFFLLMFGGGFGWILIFLGDFPPEFYIPEAFSIIILSGLPHIL